MNVKREPSFGLEPQDGPGHWVGVGPPGGKDGPPSHHSPGPGGHHPHGPLPPPPHGHGPPPQGLGGPPPGMGGPHHGPPHGPPGPPGGPGGPPPGMSPHGPGSHPPHPGHPHMGHPPPPFSRGPPRHHAPYFGQPDYRIYEMNKRLQQRTEESDNLWWDAFATEFFEDDATLTLTFCLEDGPKRYTIGRTLIPRYFRSIFEGGVSELHFSLKHVKESFHNTSISLDCDQCYMVTTHGKSHSPPFPGGRPDPLKDQCSRDNAVVVSTEGRLIVEFTFDDLMRIKSWHFAARTHRELVPRALIALHQDPQVMDQLSKNCTRQGLTNSTLNYLRLCVILEPMQELMSRHKAYSLSPRDCLKTTLFQKWQRMVAPPGPPSRGGPNGGGGPMPPSNNDMKLISPDLVSSPETQRPASKRRKRKTSTATTGTGKKKNMSPGPPQPFMGVPPGPGSQGYPTPPPPAFLREQDVMVVGEPSLMGGEFGDEDERLITRLENTQYDASAAQQQQQQNNNGGFVGVLDDNPGDDFGWNQDRNSAGGPGGPTGPPPQGDNDKNKQSPQQQNS